MPAYMSEYEDPQGELARFEGKGPAWWADVMGSIQESYTRGVGGAGREMAGRAGMVDPYAHAQRALPFQQEAMQSVKLAGEQDRLARYRQMMEEIEERSAQREQIASILGGAGGLFGAFFGPAGAKIGAAAGTMVGGFL